MECPQCIGTKKVLKGINNEIDCPTCDGKGETSLKKAKTFLKNLKNEVNNRL